MDKASSAQSLKRGLNRLQAEIWIPVVQIFSQPLRPAVFDVGLLIRTEDNQSTAWFQDTQPFPQNRLDISKSSSKCEEQT